VYAYTEWTRQKLKFSEGLVNAVRHEVESAADVAALVRRGERNRACGSTALNLHSSRSHQVVTVTVQVTERDGTGTRAKLQLVRDLLVLTRLPLVGVGTLGGRYRQSRSTGRG